MAETTYTDQSGNTYPVNSTFYTCCHSIGAHGFDCDNLTAPPLIPEPVNLDPEPELAPAILRWRELADRDIDIYHDGDIEKMMPFPRPAWAHKNYDCVGSSLLRTSYNSTVAHIPLSQTPGINHGDLWEPAYVSVRAQVWGNGVHKITVKKYLPTGDDDEKPEIQISLTLTEAIEIAQAINAAVDLIGAEEPLPGGVW